MQSSSIMLESMCVHPPPGHLGEPVLLPLWLPFSGLHHFGGVLLSDQHCDGLFPALCRGKLINCILLSLAARLLLDIHTYLTYCWLCFSPVWHISVLYEQELMHSLVSLFFTVRITGGGGELSWFQEARLSMSLFTPFSTLSTR